MKVLLIGATGATGKFLVHHLLGDERIEEVKIFVRKSTLIRHSKLKEFVMDFDKMNDWKHEMIGDVAISCLGTTLKQAGSKENQWIVDYDFQYHFAQLCKQNNVPKFVLLSSMNANEDAIFFYSKMKGRLESEVKKLNFDALDIVQPGILIRPNSDRLGERIAEKVIGVLNKVGVFRSYRATHVNDLAWVIKVLSVKKEKGTRIVSLSEIVQLLQKK